MDVVGRWRNNAFVERLWRSPKYKGVYFYACKTISNA